MRKHDWNQIQEATEFESPKPGGYIAVIKEVEDVEEKEYLKIGWDFAEGSYKGDNQTTFERAGFWPIVLIRSYKESALGFFKSFKTALENSNRGYTFDEEHLNRMVGKYIGVVLGEEGYINKNGEHKTRPYVAQTRSIDAIRKGEYKVPEYRENERGRNQTANRGYGSNSPNTTPPANQFEDIKDDGELPF